MFCGNFKISCLAINLRSWAIFVAMKTLFTWRYLVSLRARCRRLSCGLNTDCKNTLSNLTDIGGYRAEEISPWTIQNISSTKYILTSERNCHCLQVRTTELAAALKNEGNLITPKTDLTWIATDVLYFHNHWQLSRPSAKRNSLWWPL